jgi:hypothetical protein
MKLHLDSWEWEIKKWWQVPMFIIGIFLVVPALPFLIFSCLFYDK